MTKGTFLSYRVTFIVIFLSIFFLMKFISWKLQPKAARPLPLIFFLGSPLLSARLHPHRKRDSFQVILGKLLLNIAALIFCIWFGRNFLQPLSWWDLVLLSPLVYFLTESMSTLVELIFYPSSLKTFPMHQHPLRSVSLGEFWGRRWNLWVQDWLRDVTAPHRRQLKSKLFLTFLASGLFHELMVNLPWLLLYQESYFGNMVLYFTLQALGLWIDKRWIRSKGPRLRRLFLWVMVIIPSPLFLNHPLLVFLGLKS